MSFVEMKDGTQIFYKDWGNGVPMVFTHGWPLGADAWDPQMLFFLEMGYRVVAYDRRGHGRSSQPLHGHDMNTYADDLATLLDALNLSDVVLIGHGAGSGEIARYVARHGTGRIARVVMVSAVLPLLLNTPMNPYGVPLDAFNAMRDKMATCRSQFFFELAAQFYGFNRCDDNPYPAMVDCFVTLAMQGSVVAQRECLAALSEADFSEDLKHFDIPTLLIHGSDDQLVPIESTSLVAKNLIRNAIVKVYPRAPHGLCATEPDKINAEIFAFLAD